VVAYLITALLQIFHTVYQCKNFENRPIFVKVTVTDKVERFLGHGVVHQKTHTNEGYYEQTWTEVLLTVMYGFSGSGSRTRVDDVLHSNHRCPFGHCNVSISYIFWCHSIIS